MTVLRLTDAPETTAADTLQAALADDDLTALPKVVVISVDPRGYEFEWVMRSNGIRKTDLIALLEIVKARFVAEMLDE